MLLVRRRAPEGSYFTDGDRASGVFGVLATGFSVLLGFIIFLAFESYDHSRSGAETEAMIVAQQVQTAQFLPDDGRGAHRRAGLLRAHVAGTEWDAIAAGHSATRSTRGAQRCSGRSRRSTRRQRPSSRPTTGGWTRRPTGSRRVSRGSTERRASSHSRCGWLSSPSPAVIFGYMLFFADRGSAGHPRHADGQRDRRHHVLLLLLVFFDHPHGDGVGRLQPTAMERTLRLIDIQLDVVGLEVTASL